MFLDFAELFDMIITILAIGYLVMGIFRRERYYFSVDDLKNDFWESCLLVSPAIILHELAHKITATAFGFEAVYHANFFGLAVGVIFKYLGLPIIFIPAYVSIIPTASAVLTKWAFFITALSGPLTNLALFAVSSFFLKNEKYARQAYIVRTVNIWLFLFNLIPLPGTDGMQALRALFS